MQKKIKIHQFCNQPLNNAPRKHSTAKYNVSDLLTSPEKPER